MKTEAETGDMLPCASEYQGLSTTTRKLEGTKKNSSLESLQEAWPCQHLDFRLLDIGTVRQSISVISL